MRGAVSAGARGISYARVGARLVRARRGPSRTRASEGRLLRARVKAVLVRACVGRVGRTRAWTGTGSFAWAAGGGARVSTCSPARDGPRWARRVPAAPWARRGERGPLAERGRATGRLSCGRRAATPAKRTVAVGSPAQVGHARRRQRPRRTGHPAVGAPRAAPALLPSSPAPGTGHACVIRAEVDDTKDGERGT
ncbi:hypothetical protein SHJG_7160 [Streptomyces hygroscopicus subsp. jinggangensis 5008]|nr:hypothetical protein SHJG_7160 [Streptomyces hygroscopicus subsp. jinggangensis 5008]AGF66582.1 hypothetical protein SHJGH_6920 [Streptomyces hygroscopicus subsp. jinggangensis TL01]